ncbi:MAG: hypothetical protein FWH23_08035 [Bacteroidales bacterium]|nr:hypothetical protein [Bacteroidales bacterium]
MDNLKTYINQHRREFDAEEPTAGHFERLEAKLAAAQQRSKSRRALSYWPLYAAAATVLLLVSLGLNWFFSTKQSDNPLIDVCDNPATMKLCYLNKMQDTAMYIDELTRDADPFVRQALQMEVADIIDNNRSFDRELPTELLPEAAHAILSNYYQHHLETLQDIAQNLSASNSIN